MASVAVRQSGTQKKVPGTDKAVMREVFRLAALSMEPAERSQRQTVRDLMPEIFMMKKAGYSFQQVATLMNENGFDLQPSTLRSYFGIFMQEHQDNFVNEMADQVLILEEMKKETRGTEISQIARKAAAIRAKQKENAAATADAVLGGLGGGVSGRAGSGSGAGAGALESPVGMREPPAYAVGEGAKKQEVPAAAPPGNLGAGSAQSAAPASAPSGSGLLDGVDGVPAGAGSDVSAGHVKTAGGSRELQGEGDPVVPVLSDVSTATVKAVAVSESRVGANVGSSVPLRCKPLRKDVKQMPRRASVPEAVYQEGILEHPAIPGLMLSRDERLYSALLEIDDGKDGFVEAVKDKMFRLKWTKPVPPTQTATGAGFVKMDAKLFADVGKKSNGNGDG